MRGRSADQVRTTAGRRSVLPRCTPERPRSAADATAFFRSPARERGSLFTWVGMHETLQALQRWLNTFEAAMGLDQERYLVEEEWSDADEVAQLLRKGMSA